jgi:hypothetical protein
VTFDTLISLNDDDDGREVPNDGVPKWPGVCLLSLLRFSEHAWVS